MLTRVLINSKGEESDQDLLNSLALSETYRGDVSKQRDEVTLSNRESFEIPSPRTFSSYVRV